jgi:hypothetical protein
MKPEQKNVIKSNVKTTIDLVTGEITEIQTDNQYRVDREPDFVKLYLGDIGRLYNLPNTSLLMALLRKMNYDNEVILNAAVKRELSSSIGGNMGLANIEKIIGVYVKRGVLIRKDRGIYLFNPYLFGRGKWQDVNKIRLSISYEPGVREVTAEINHSML